MTVEQPRVGDLDPNAMRWYYKSQGTNMVLLMLFLFGLWRAVGVVADLIVSWWSTKAPMIGYTNISDKLYLQWFGIFVALQLVMLFVRQVPFVIGMLDACKAVHEAMLNSLLRAPTSFYDTTPAGRILARFSKDIEMVDLVIPEGLNYGYNFLFMTLGVFALVCYASLWLIILVVGIMIAYFAIWRYSSATNRAQR